MHDNVRLNKIRKRKTDGMDNLVTGIQKVYAPKIGQHLWLLRENGNVAFKIIIGL